VPRAATPLQRAARPFLARVAAWLIRALGATWRLSEEGPDPFADAARPVLGALWHRNVLIAAWRFRDRRVVVIVSRSRDGDWIEALLARLGYAPSPRGSSSRGGAEALRRQIRAARATGVAALLPDGPRGPAGVAKPGVIVLARASGGRLWPVAFAARPALRLGSWDRMLLPLPFARVHCVFGDPLALPEAGDAGAREGSRRALEQRLHALTARADAALGLAPGSDAERGAQGA